MSEDGRSRLTDLLEEYVALDTELRKLEDTEFRVCIFGSARISDRHPTYKEVYRLARSLAKLGVGIVTGGGPGLMEAANRGVRDARNETSKSYGLPIDIPSLAEVPNPHLDIKSQHKRFSSRLDEFIRLTHAVIVAPGGIGTLLELMYVWQLLQVGLVDRRPVILLGRELWGGLLDWMKEQMTAKGYVGAHDFDWIQVVDTPKEAVALIRKELVAFNERRLALAAAVEAIPDMPEPLPWTVSTEVLPTNGAELLTSPLANGAHPAPSSNGRKRRVARSRRTVAAPYSAP
jgi:uncharacterized protein (TIGR00730 family)